MHSLILYFAAMWLALGLMLCSGASLGAAEHRGSVTHTATHQFGEQHARILWGTQGARRQNILRNEGSDVDDVHQGQPRRLSSQNKEFSVLHISDAHISLVDDDPPRTTRMYDAFRGTTDRVTGKRTTSSAEFVQLMKLACSKKVDLIALGGDIVNFPSKQTVDWVLEQLHSHACGIPFVYTAGNHDWHEEGFQWEKTYDAQRVPQLHSTLRPLFEQSVTAPGTLYGHVNMKGVDVMFIDNSNHQINDEQLAFARKHLKQASHSTPLLLLLHMPLALPGVHLEPKYVAGHPNWGPQSDENWKVEARPRWPEEGNLPSTLAFMSLVEEHAAPVGRIAALLTGHVHRDFNVPAAIAHSSLVATNYTALACDFRHTGCNLRTQRAKVFQAGSSVGGAEKLQEADGAVQYTVLDAAEGGYRLLTIQTPS